jgi:hypothetical protein
LLFIGFSGIIDNRLPKPSTPVLLMMFTILTILSIVVFLALLFFYVTEVELIHGLPRRVIGNVFFALWFLISSVVVLAVPILVELYGVGYAWSIPVYLIEYKIIRFSFEVVFRSVHGITTHNFCLASADAAEVEPERDGS